MRIFVITLTFLYLTFAFGASKDEFSVVIKKGIRTDIKKKSKQGDFENDKIRNCIYNFKIDKKNSLAKVKMTQKILEHKIEEEYVGLVIEHSKRLITVIIPLKGYDKVDIFTLYPMEKTGFYFSSCDGKLYDKKSLEHYPTAKMFKVEFVK